MIGATIWYPQFANVSADFNASGSGSIRFHLINIRSQFIFAFLRNGTDYPILVATSEVVRFSNPDAPSQGRLALHTLPDHMRVMWHGGGNVSNMIAYGTAKFSLNQYVIALHSTYTADDLCGSPATDIGWLDPGMIHYAVIGPLIPGQLYFYRYGSDINGWSDVYNLTGPIGADPNRGIKVIAFGG